MPARNKHSRTKPIRRPKRLKLIEAKSATKMIPFTVDPNIGQRQMPGEKTITRAPTAPKWLSPEAQKVWKRAIRQMIDAATWNPVFESHLSVYCVLLAEFESDPAAFKATKLTTLRLYAGDLGLSPSTIDKVVRLKRR